MQETCKSKSDRETGIGSVHADHKNVRKARRRKFYYWFVVFCFVWFFFKKKKVEQAELKNKSTEVSTSLTQIQSGYC